MIQTITVSALNRYVKAKLESDENLRSVLVEGELSGCNLYSSGHLYFEFKDEKAQISAVMWRSSLQKLKFLPENGMKVVIRGTVSLYETKGTYQLVAQDMQLAGLGEQEKRLRELTEKLKNEGLFDLERKKPLPMFPKTIAVITSRNGAALQDVIKVVSRRWPLTKLLVCHTSVQGVLAEDEIVDAIRLASSSRADLAIITRGGGSKEDLFVFNSEKIARAAAALSIPLISAVGHEIDTTIIDLVSDRREPTPSAAAEAAVPDMNAVLAHLSGTADAMKSSMLLALSAGRQKLEYLQNDIRSEMDSTLSSREDDIRSLKEDIKDGELRLLADLENKLMASAAVTDSVSPLRVLSRGYARVTKSDSAVTSAADLHSGDEINVMFSDGNVTALVR